MAVRGVLCVGGVRRGVCSVGEVRSIVATQKRTQAVPPVLLWCVQAGSEEATHALILTSTLRAEIKQLVKKKKKNVQIVQSADFGA